MQPLVVYCEVGAYTGTVKGLVRQGSIRIIHGPYERKFKAAQDARPSLVTCDSTVWTCDSAYLISDMCHSPKHARIVEIIGPGKVDDALHLDSAFKSNAYAFLTPDKHDIARHATALQELLGLRVFHMPSQSSDFSDWVHEQTTAQ